MPKSITFDLDASTSGIDAVFWALAIDYFAFFQIVI
jgi:hypothetical protein